MEIQKEQSIKEIVRDNCLSNDQLLKYAARQNILNCKIEDLKEINEVIIHSGIEKKDAEKLYNQYKIKEDYIGRELKIFVNKNKIILPISLGIQREKHFILLIKMLEVLFNKKIKLSFRGNKKNYENIFLSWKKRFNYSIQKNKIDSIDTVIFGSTYLFKHIFISKDFFIELEKLISLDSRIKKLVEENYYSYILRLTIYRQEKFVKKILMKNKTYSYFDLTKQSKINQIGIDKIKEFVENNFLTNSKFKEIFNNLKSNDYLRKLGVHGYVYYDLRQEKEFAVEVQKLYYKFLSNIVEVEDDYIKYQLIKIDGKTILNFNYCYGAQAKYILDSVLDKFNVNNIFVYGSCGGFEKEFNLTDLVIPHASKNANTQYYFDNILSEGEDYKEEILNKNILVKNSGVMLNVSSPLIETKSFLTKEIRFAKISSVEMELHHIVKSCYKNNFKGNFGAIFYVSDKPLENHGLGMAEDLSSGVKHGTEKILNCLKNIWWREENEY